MANDGTLAITLLYFASASAATGRESEVISLPPASEGSPFTLQNLSDLLIARYQKTALPQVLVISQWSVQVEMVTLPLDQVVLRGGEHVAIIPPVSGG